MLRAGWLSVVLSLQLPAIFDATGAALGGSSDARMLLLTGVVFMVAGVAFKLACSAREYGWFLTHTWIRDWLVEVYTEARAEWTRERLDRDLQGNRHLGHYLNLLSLLRRPRR